MEGERVIQQRKRREKKKKKKKREGKKKKKKNRKAAYLNVQSNPRCRYTTDPSGSSGSSGSSWPEGRLMHALYSHL